ncbi:MAG: MerR family transcriptional regulator [Gemmatimonadota bacterium]|nr:MerR family transcriptional regulator [Gemmatimonadota bacterium]
MLKVGDVAAECGLSVRTLHHYDEIGLLRPGARSAGGHRLYGRAELERLQQILSLRQLGFSLDETKACLDDPRFSLQRTLEMHRDRLDEHIERARSLRERLILLAARVKDEGLTADELLSTMREMTLLEEYYTPEQLQELARRRDEAGPDALEAVQNQWLGLASRVGESMAAGEDPASESVQALAREWRDLTAETVAGFTAGDPGIADSLGRLWAEQPSVGEKWGLGPEVREYIGRAIALL